jgi:hypothetical protein
MASTINFGMTRELAHAVWRKSSNTGGGSGGGGNCVEVAASSRTVGIRDSKDPKKSTLAFSPDQWKSLIRGVKHGEFDL